MTGLEAEVCIGGHIEARRWRIGPRLAYAPCNKIGSIQGEFIQPMTTGVVVRRARGARVGLLAAAIVAGVCAGVVPVDAGRLPSRVRSQLLLRIGDAAPIQARVPESFGGTLGYLPDGRVTFVAGSDELLGVVEGGKARTLLHIGQTVEGCGALRGILYHAAGLDGTIAAFVYCNEGLAILRVDASSGAASVAVMSEQYVPGADPSSILSNVSGTAVDGAGGIIARRDNGLDFHEIVRQSPGREPEVLIKTGDPLGGGTLARLRREPSVEPSGTVAFAALTSLGDEVIAVLPPGGSPRVLLSVPSQDPSNWYAPPFSLAPPAINAAGVVGVLSGDSTHASVLRIDAGGNVSGVHAGDPAPGGGTFEDLNWVYPAVDADGGVIFGAQLAGGASGLYRFDGATVAEVASSGSGGFVSVGDWSLTPLPCPDGALRFVAGDELGYAVFALRNGTPTVEVRAGDEMEEPARFIKFATGGDHLSSGPSMASDGAIVFDAWTTGRRRSLFLRQPDGTLLPVAIDGEPGPAGGRFLGDVFEFHSVAPGGRVAFIGEAAPDGPFYPRRELYAGRVGQLQRLLGEGDSLPWWAAPIESLQPPSAISAGGTIVVPVTMTDGWTFLVAWDGTRWLRLAATGDALPDGGIISKIEAGAPDAPLAPQLGDDGSIVFGVTTIDGAAALYRMNLDRGLDSAARLVGHGDPVPGGTLTPFVPQAFSADHDGRLAFQAAPSGDPYPGTYVLVPGGAATRLLVPDPPLTPPPPPPGFERPPRVALPRLAMVAGGGVVYEETHYGPKLVLAMPRPSRRGFEQTILIGPNSPSPDGGFFARGGFGIGPGFGGRPGDPNRPAPSPMRLGSDGSSRIVAVEPTSVNAEILVLFDLGLERRPLRRN